MAMMVSRKALTAAALLLVPAQPALALDAEDFGAKFRETFRVMGLNLDFASARAEGDTVVLSDFTFVIPGEEPAEIEGDLTFTGVAETGDGGYTAERAAIEDIDVSDDELSLTMTLRDIAAEGLVIPADPAADPVTASVLYERIGAGPFALTVEGQETLSFGRFEVWIDADDALTEIESGYSLTDGVFTLPPLDDSELEESDREILLMIEEFGLSRVGFGLEGVGTWYTETGILDMPELSVTLEDLGSLSVSMRLANYTADFHAEVIDIQQRLAVLDEAAGEEELAAIDRELVQLFGRLEIESLAVRYEDASLVPRALEFAGAQQGISGETMAQGLSVMAPMVLSEIDDPNFVESATEALNAFLADPQSLEIAAEPEAPVRISEVLKVAEDPSPAPVIELLRLTVRANQ